MANEEIRKLGDKLREAMQEHTLTLLRTMVLAGFSYEQAAGALSPIMFGHACRLAVDAGVPASAIHATIDDIVGGLRAQPEAKA